MGHKDKLGNRSLYAIWEKKGVGVSDFRAKESNSQEEEKEEMFGKWMFAGHKEIMGHKEEF